MAPSQFEQEVEHEFEHPSSLRAVKDLAAGAAGGVAQVLIGRFAASSGVCCAD